LDEAYFYLSLPLTTSKIIDIGATQLKNTPLEYASTQQETFGLVRNFRQSSFWALRL
jgi:hypothetical protein